MELLQPIKISAREENKNVCTHTKIYIYAEEKKNMIVETLSLE